MQRVSLAAISVLLLSLSTISLGANAQIQIALTPTPAPTAAPDESYKETNRYVNPELGWSISWSEDDDWEAEETEHFFVLRQSNLEPELYVWILNIDSPQVLPKDQSARARVESCVRTAGSDSSFELLTGANGEELMEFGEEDGWAVYGENTNFGPRTLYAHCFIIPGESRMALFRAQLGTPQDFNDRAPVIDELIGSFEVPGS